MSAVHRLYAVFAAVCVSLAGCTDPSDPQPGAIMSDVGVSCASDVRYVCVGMEVSDRFGPCAGCAKDATRMDDLLRAKFGYSGTLLVSEQATRAAFVQAVRDAVADTHDGGLFILYYSGHGGRESLGSLVTSEPEGADDEDEYLCLYDTYLLDDEVWSLVEPCRGRVFMVFDCCHSQTMFRSVSIDVALSRGFGVSLDAGLVRSSGFDLGPRAAPLDMDGLRMLCWSGCLESEYSYGGPSGGVMACAILAKWKRGMTYAALWDMVREDVESRQPGQHPACTLYGGVFREAFR